MERPWIGKFTIVNMASLPKLISRFTAVLIKILAAFFFFDRNGQDDSKMYIKISRTENSQNNFEKE